MLVCPIIIFFVCVCIADVADMLINGVASRRRVWRSAASWVDGCEPGGGLIDFMTKNRRVVSRKMSSEKRRERKKRQPQHQEQEPSTFDVILTLWLLFFLLDRVVFVIKYMLSCFLCARACTNYLSQNQNQNTAEARHRVAKRPPGAQRSAARAH